jgi:hypothetical protein
MCDLYDLVQTLVQKFQKKYKNLDHEKLITAMDALLTRENVSELELPAWHKDLGYGEDMYCTFTKKVLLLPEKIISGHGTIELITKNHFMIQIFRIPFRESPTLGNLLKVALYSGLLIGNLRVNDFPDGIVKAYKDLKMHNLINFVNREDYTTLMKKMPDDMTKKLNECLIEAAHEA